MGKYIWHLIITSIFCILTGCQKVDLSADENPTKPNTPTGTNSGVQPAPEDYVYNPSIDTIYIKDVELVEGELWENHLVYYINDYNPDAVIAMLIARDEFTNVCSANNESRPDHAKALAASYSEDGMTGWAIPDDEDAEYLHDCIVDDDLKRFNASLAQYKPIGTQSRYLCDGGYKSFAFTINSKISAAGAVKKYSLRPVKTVIFINPEAQQGGDDSPNDDQEVNPGDTNGDSHNDDVIPTDKQCFKWNGHAVVKYDKETGEALLISTSQWNDIADSLKTKKEIKEYEEGSITGWSIPTKEEAEYLRDVYGYDSWEYIMTGSFGKVQQLIDLLKKSEDEIPIALGEKDRYLCADGNKTFSFNIEKGFVNAGDKTSYFLRLVKTIKID